MFDSENDIQHVKLEFYKMHYVSELKKTAPFTLKTLQLSFFI